MKLFFIIISILQTIPSVGEIANQISNLILRCLFDLYKLISEPFRGQTDTVSSTAFGLIEKIIRS